MREMVGVKWLEKETFLRTVRNGLVYIYRIVSRINNLFFSQEIEKRRIKERNGREMVSRSLRILQSDSLALPTSLFTWRRRLSSCRLASRRRWCRDQVPCLRKCIRSRSLWAKRFPTETEITSTTLHQCFTIIPQARGITSAFNSIASVFVYRSNRFILDRLPRPAPSIPFSTTARPRLRRSNRPTCCSWYGCDPWTGKAREGRDERRNEKRKKRNKRMSDRVLLGGKWFRTYVTYTNQSMVKRRETL